MNRPALDRAVLVLVLAVNGALLLPGVAAAQGTPADYARAQQLRATYEGLAVDIAGPATWIGNTHRFWYRKTVRGAEQFVVVDADTQQRQPAFDHEKIAASLSKAAGSSFTATTLPFNTFAFTDDERGVHRHGRRRPVPLHGGRRHLPEGGGRRRAGAGLGVGRRRQDDSPRLSPDGQWEALINNFNVAVRPAGARSATRSAPTAPKATPTSSSSIAWSPDSKKIAAYRVRPGYRRLVHYVESSPDGSAAAEVLVAATTRSPATCSTSTQPVLFDVDDEARRSRVDNALFPNAVRRCRELAWRKDSRAFTFEYNQRGHQVYRVIEVDAATGTRARGHRRRAEDVLRLPHARTARWPTRASSYRYDVDDGKEIIWMSERDGWNHLYLYDGATGAGEEPDHQGRRGSCAASSASTRRSGRSGSAPAAWIRARIRTSSTTTGSTSTAPASSPLTEGDGNHTRRRSRRDSTYYVDTYSRVDLPPVLELRRTERSEAGHASSSRATCTALLAAGWQAAGGLRRQGPRRQDRHLGRHRPADELRSRRRSIR